MFNVAIINTNHKALPSLSKAWMTPHLDVVASERRKGRLRWYHRSGMQLLDSACRSGFSGGTGPTCPLLKHLNPMGGVHSLLPPHFSLQVSYFIVLSQLWVSSLQNMSIQSTSRGPRVLRCQWDNICKLWRVAAGASYSEPNPCPRQFQQLASFSTSTVLLTNALFNLVSDSK